MQEQPTIMISQTQEKELKRLGLWTEPVIRPDNYFEDMLAQCQAEAIKRLRNISPKKET